MLEGRCPRLSMADYRYIKNAFQDGSAFSMIKDPNLRSKMQHAVLGYRKIIPSLRTFLENTKYLKAMTDVVKKILPVNFKGTIRQAMFRYYMAPRNQQFYIQSLENDFVQRVGPKDFGFWSAYRQLFLFAMRHFCGMTDSQPLGFSQSSRARCLDRSELWQRLRLLISKIGFVIPGSKFNSGTNYLEFTAILGLLTRLRPPELFEYEENQMTEWSTKVASFLGSMTPRVATIPVPIQTCDRSENWSLQSRCGMTDTESFFLDQKYLFLENIYSPDHTIQENMTSFAVKRDIFRSFFSDLDLIDMERTREQDAGDQIFNREGAPPTVLQNTEDTGMVGSDQPIVYNQPAPVQSTDLGTEVSSHPLPIVQGTVPTQSNQVTQISEMTPIVCKCTVNMTPDDFYAAFTKLPPYNGVIFFDIATSEVLFFRAETANQAHEWIEDLDDRWYARVVDDAFSLKTFSPNEVFTICQNGPCFFFHGRRDESSFKSQLTPAATDTETALPCFSPETNTWSLQSGLA